MDRSTIANVMANIAAILIQDLSDAECKELWAVAEQRTDPRSFPWFDSRMLALFQETSPGPDGYPVVARAMLDGLRLALTMQLFAERGGDE